MSVKREFRIRDYTMIQLDSKKYSPKAKKQLKMTEISNENIPELIEHSTEEYYIDNEQLSTPESPIVKKRLTTIKNNGHTKDMNNQKKNLKTSFVWLAMKLYLMNM